LQKLFYLALESRKIYDGSLLRNHPALACVIEQAAGVHDGADVAERFELDDFAGRLDGDGGGVEVNSHDVAGLQRVTEAFGDFARIEFAGGDGVAEENARETFREDNFASSRAERDGRVLARTAAAEIFPADNDGIVAVKRAFLDKARGVKRFGQAVEREAAELLVFFGNRRDERKMLRGNDLVGVNVVAHDINGAGKNRFRHAVNVPRLGNFFNQI
jgi:hypothetical protein